MADEAKPTPETPASNQTPAPEPQILTSPAPAPKPETKAEAKSDEKPITKADLDLAIKAAVEAALKAQKPAEQPKVETKTDTAGEQALARLNEMERNNKIEAALNEAKVTDPRARELIAKTCPSELDKIAEHVKNYAPVVAAAAPPARIPDGGPPNGGGPTNDLIGANPMLWPKGTAKRFLEGGKLHEMRERIETWAFKGSNSNPYAHYARRK